MTTTPTTTAKVLASLVTCYNSPKLSCYKAVTPAIAHSKSDKFCIDYAPRNVSSNGPAIYYVSNNFSDLISYHWMVLWKPDCVAANGQSTMNVGQPIPGFSCQDAMRKALEDCDNEVHGGVFEVECLRYYVSPVNQGDISCSLPFL
ncbi:hypothetical protein GGR54DRAFT_619511 [Hypoxylon sp. NC1633]|nr:hypothetical protein GGR54DRAFT_619511 [Hypoxylon sp. NC1633]